MHEHRYWMEYALKEAQKAFEFGEVPVGAIIVYKGQIIAKGYNQALKPISKPHASLDAEDRHLKSFQFQVDPFLLRLLYFSYLTIQLSYPFSPPYSNPVEFLLFPVQAKELIQVSPAMENLFSVDNIRNLQAYKFFLNQDALKI